MLVARALPLSSLGSASECCLELEAGMKVVLTVPLSAVGSTMILRDSGGKGVAISSTLMPSP